MGVEGEKTGRAGQGRAGWCSRDRREGSNGEGRRDGTGGECTVDSPVWSCLLHSREREGRVRLGMSGARTMVGERNR